jgi:hypothetical protein
VFHFARGYRAAAKGDWAAHSHPAFAYYSHLKQLQAPDQDAGRPPPELVVIFAICSVGCPDCVQFETTSSLMGRAVLLVANFLNCN